MKNILYIFLLLNLFTSCTQAQQKKDEIAVSKILKLIEKGEPVFYSNVRITGDLDLTTIMNGNEESVGEIRNYFNSSITFQNCIFEGKIIAFKKEEKYAIFTTFLKNISFIKCTFTQTVSFRDTDVEGSVNFTESIFHEEANFEGLRAKGRTTSFNNCVFNAETHFQRIECFSASSFFKVTFAKAVNFQASYFHKEAMFRSCKFSDKANYSSMTIIGGFSMNYSEFESSFTLQNTNIFDRAEFNNCTFKNTVLFKGNSFFGECKIQKSTINNKIEIVDCLFVNRKPEFEETIFAKEFAPEITNSFFLNENTLQIDHLMK